VASQNSIAIITTAASKPDVLSKSTYIQNRMCCPNQLIFKSIALTSHAKFKPEAKTRKLNFLVKLATDIRSVKLKASQNNIKPQPNFKHEVTPETSIRNSPPKRMQTRIQRRQSHTLTRNANEGND
jgi:hypothetical protein